MEKENKPDDKPKIKKQSIIKKRNFLVIGILCSFFIVPSLLYYFFFGIGRSEVRNALEDKSILNRNRVHLQIEDFDLDYYKATIGYSLDWDKAKGGYPWKNYMSVPGRVSLDLQLSTIDIIDFISGQNKFSIPISNSGIYFEKNRTQVLSATAYVRDVESLPKKVELLKFIDSTFFNKKYDIDHFPWELIAVSELPNNLHLIELYKQLQQDKLDIFNWIRFAFLDFKTSSNRLVRENHLRGKSNSIFDKFSSFVFSIDKNKVKFGIKKYKINEYGEIIENSIKYQQIEALFNIQNNSWKLNSIKDFDENLDDELAVIVEMSEFVRSIIYIVGLFIFLYFGLLILSKFANFIKSIISLFGGSKSTKKK